MRKKQSLLLTLIFAVCFGLTNLYAQKTPDKAKVAPAKTNLDKAMPAPTGPALAAEIPCDGCSHIEPTAVLTSYKNAVTIFGPPDSKGDPVEFQVYSKNKGERSWTLRANGHVDQPGAKVTHKYYQPGQLMVLIYCRTPFGDMAKFSNVKMAAPRVVGDPCTDCACERCQQKVPTAIFSSELNGVTVTRKNGAESMPLEYHVFTREKGAIWQNKKTAIIKGPGGSITTCDQKAAETMVLVYDKNPDHIEVNFAPVPCDK